MRLSRFKFMALQLIGLRVKWYVAISEWIRVPTALALFACPTSQYAVRVALLLTALTYA